MKGLIEKLSSSSSDRLVTLLSIIKKEIENINTKHKSLGFTFPEDERKVIVPQMERLMAYFKRIANSDREVNVLKIDELYHK